MQFNYPITTTILNKLEPVYQRFEWVVLGLLTVILLIPKFQLISVGGTYVNVRIEDFLVAGVYLVWFFGLVAGRYSLQWVFNHRILILYLVYGLVITLLGIYLFRTVQEPHLGIIHWARRVEYFGMYFVAATVCKKENLHKYLYLLLGVGVLTWIYGLLQWQDLVPGVHTLSKSGELGTFSDLGYVISTFAAHYDYGGFLILMVMLSVWGYFSHQVWWKRTLFVILAIGFWWMSRLVYGRAAYLGMLVGLIVVLMIKMSGWVILPLWEVFQTFDRYFGGKFSRYTYNFKFNIIPEIPAPVPPPTAVVTSPTPAPIGFGDLVGKVLDPSNSSVNTETPGQVGSSIGSTTALAKQWLDDMVSFLSTKLRAWFGRLDIDLDPSANIRLVEWQDALARVGYHFLWGGGYYTNGLGTDNDYVRKIVEVGIIGLAMFLLIIRDFLRITWRSYTSLSIPHLRYFHLAMIGFIIGLLVEAIFIDIFEASKIAFLFWYLMGLVALFEVQTTETQSSNVKGQNQNLNLET